MYLNKVGVGQQLTLRMDALPGEDRPGLVYAVSPLVDAGGRSILLRATVANRDAVLRPGMFARVQLQFAQDQALVVPEAALTPSGQAQYVYRVRDGVAERRAVTIGERREGLVEILTGVGEGDQLVVAGLQRVTDGAPVQIGATAPEAPIPAILQGGPPCAFPKPASSGRCSHRSCR